MVVGEEVGVFGDDFSVIQDRGANNSGVFKFRFSYVVVSFSIN